MITTSRDCDNPARMSTIETTTRLTPRWNEHGLIPAIAQDATSGAVLMLAWMNEEALRKTLQTGRATYWSRSRSALWIKGEESGHTQRVIDVMIDCDQDCLLLKVEQTGPACHTGAPTCWYRRILADGSLEPSR
jgi:phosphoribosyl-AMP cyclohydrolase